MNVPTIIIPAYNPDERMNELIRALTDEGFINIIVINDGSTPECEELFTQAARQGCYLLTHAINLGKGRALKNAFNFALAEGLADSGVVTVDADGQHTPKDVARLAEVMHENPGALVLGVRTFGKDVPLRSRFGNKMTALIFSFVNGGALADTQTGLRGMGSEALKRFLPLAGERYEYEMNMLLYARRFDIPLVQVPIETIYLDKNSASHFNPLIDSFKIYTLLLSFVASSLISFGVDYAVFAAVNILVPGQLFLSVVSARVISSLFNFSVNHSLVFHEKAFNPATFFKYYILVVVVMLCSYGLIYVLSNVLHINVYFAKVISDAALYLLSFFAQREFVFKHKKG